MFYNISVNEPPTYERYMEILDKVKLGIEKNDIPCMATFLHYLYG